MKALVDAERIEEIRVKRDGPGRPKTLYRSVGD